MPWTGASFKAKHNKKLPAAKASKAAAQANAILKKTGDEGLAIAVANKDAKSKSRGPRSKKADLALKNAEGKPKPRGPGKPFQPGQVANPLGRPKGSRHKLSEAFLRDLCAEWEKSGIAAIRKLADEDNTNFVKVIASLIPKEVTGEDGGPLTLKLIRGDDSV